MIDGQIAYDGTPEIMAEYAVEIIQRGAKLIGACCGSTPEHIAAMSRALEH
jgi:5-methyltetrahydrofolate--homocysteine methyltransferase